VLEMGMRGLGQIDYLANIAKPDVGIVTNIGVSHIEQLGSQENIFKAETEISAHIKHGGFLVLNGDDEFLNTIENCDNVKLMRYGIENPTEREGMPALDVYGDNIYISDDGTYTEFELHVKSMPCEIYNVRINAPGKHNVYNALCAVCVGIIFGMNISDIIDGIADFAPSGMRQNMITVKTGAKTGLRIIDDSYNASPDSVKAALDTLELIRCDGKRIAVLGDMFELGEEAERYHVEVGDHYATKNIDLLITVGELARRYGNLEGTVPFDKASEALAYIKEIIKAEDIILFKASRGMQFDKMVTEIQGD